MRGWQLLGVLFVGGALLVSGSARASPPNWKSYKPLKVDKPPVECKDQCQLIQSSCEHPCHMLHDKPDAMRACTRQCRSMSKACYGSCKKYGKIEKTYMLEHLKPPQRHGGGDSMDDGDSSGGSSQDNGGGQ